MQIINCEFSIHLEDASVEKSLYHSFIKAIELTLNGCYYNHGDYAEMDKKL